MSKTTGEIRAALGMVNRGLDELVELGFSVGGVRYALKRMEDELPFLMAVARSDSDLDLSRPIDDLAPYLPTRVMNILRREGASTIGDVLKTAWWRLPHFGAKSELSLKRGVKEFLDKELD